MTNEEIEAKNLAAKLNDPKGVIKGSSLLIKGSSLLLTFGAIYNNKGVKSPIDVWCNL